MFPFRTWAFCLALAGPAGSTSDKIQPAQLREDFRILRGALEDGHSGIYRYTPKKTLDRLFDEAQVRLNRPLDELEFYRLVAPVVTSIKCGHTEIVPSESFRAKLASEVPVFPLEVAALDDGVYIVRDYATGDGRLVGLQLMSINGVPVQRVVTEMTQATSRDGNIPTSRLRQLRGPGFRTYLHTFLGIQSPYRLILRERNGRRISVELGGLSLPALLQIARSRYPKDHQPSQTTELKFLEGARIAVMTIRSFSGPVREFLPRAFGQIADKRSSALILDLRDNAGGEDALGKQLLSYLLDEPFQYYRDLVINALWFDFFRYSNSDSPLPSSEMERRPDGKYRQVKHPNWGLQQPSSPHFPGKVFVLINGGSFSTTCEFLSNLHYRKRATFIGEEAGGGYYGNSSGFTRQVTLPNSKLRLRVPLMTYYLAVSGYRRADRGVMPDRSVRYSISDLLAGTDKEMSIALELARADSR